MVRIRMISKFYDGHLGEAIGSAPSKQKNQHHLQIIGGVRQDVFHCKWPGGILTVVNIYIYIHPHKQTD